MSSSVLNLLAVFTVVSHALGLTGILPNIQVEVRVIGGEKAGLGEFPWQAWIEGFRYFIGATGCGGSLVTTRHIITAAHCVQGVSFYQVYLGVVNRVSNEGISMYVPGNRAVSHPDYRNSGYEDDIAIITLKKAVITSASIRPISLPQPWELSTNLDGKSALVSGFGKTEDDESNAHPTLQFARLQIFKHSLCKQFYKTYFGILLQNGQICTTYKDFVSGVCSGDSGGPLVIQGSSGVATLVGVVSLGVEPCETGAPSVYTAVAAYLTWINGIINGRTIVR